MNIIQKVDRGIMKVEELILSYSVILISLMVVGNVVSRTITGKSWAFAGEISEFAVILATFMGISYAARKGRHISMSAFFDVAPPKIRKALAIVIPAVTAIILLVLAYYAFGYMVSVFEKGRVTIALQIPVWILLIFIPVGLILGSLQFIRNMWINIKEKEVYLATEKKDYSEN
ncbi:TRAP transporter small permease [Alkalihalobacillus sp. BA299]|uniref:TRAP transporter small permease n=1 Tax=Alkalihalobacillus sp. BA299 TaxID=2815938 RepID=UPI001ADD3710|nr:TRAP transporter small permease [Alkalihalobacillus sp. BA299]